MLHRPHKLWHWSGIDFHTMWKAKVGFVEFFKNAETKSYWCMHMEVLSSICCGKAACAVWCKSIVIHTCVWKLYFLSSSYKLCKTLTYCLQVPGLQIQKPEWMTINWWKLANLNYLARFSNESARSCYFRLNKGNNDQLKANLLQFWIAPVPLFILLLLSSQWLHIGSFCTNTNFISMILYFGHFSMKKLNFLPKKEKPTNSI